MAAGTGQYGAAFVWNAIYDPTTNAIQIESTASGSNANVQRVTSGAAAPGQTLKQYAGAQLMTSGGSIALETVTAGKTFYITDIYFGTDATTVAVINIQAAGTTIFPCAISTTAPCDMAGLDTQPSASTGQAVTVQYPVSSGKTLYYFVAGYEQ